MTVLLQSAAPAEPSAPPNAFSPPPGNYVAIAAALSHPLLPAPSTSTSSDPAAPPAIDHRYFSHPADLEIQAHHVSYTEKIATTKPFAHLLKPNTEGLSPTALLRGDLDKVKEHIRLDSGTNYHSCGTCAAGAAGKRVELWTSGLGCMG